MSKIKLNGTTAWVNPKDPPKIIHGGPRMRMQHLESILRNALSEYNVREPSEAVEMAQHLEACWEEYDKRFVVVVPNSE